MMKLELEAFDYNDFTLEELEQYNHYSFICDGDNKKITAELNEEEE